MEVKIKRLGKDAVIPKYAKPGDAGLDLVATSVDRENNGNIVYGTQLAVEIPEGYVGLLFPRSSVSKYDLFQTNSVGVIDSGYRGEIMIKFKATPLNVVNPTIYQLGDRIGQLIILPYPQIDFVEVEELSISERGEGGFGSTNKEDSQTLLNKITNIVKSAAKF